MNPTMLTETLPEAMGDVPGICELPLTRAVVQYRDVHEMDTPGGRIEDIGLAVVVEGRYASSAEALDLGSGQMKILDLSTELVVLDWVYEPTLEHINGLVAAAAASQDQDGLRRYGFRLGAAVPGARRLQPPHPAHPPAHRLPRHLPRPGPARGHVDPDRARARAPHARPPGLRRLCTPVPHGLPGARRGVWSTPCSDAFPDAEVRRLVPALSSDVPGYQVRFPAAGFARGGPRMPRTGMRRGIGALVARYEPERFDALDASSRPSARGRRWRRFRCGAPVPMRCESPHPRRRRWRCTDGRPRRPPRSPPSHRRARRAGRSVRAYRRRQAARWSTCSRRTPSAPSTVVRGTTSPPTALRAWPPSRTTRSRS